MTESIPPVTPEDAAIGAIRAEEALVREACLKVTNDPRLSAREKRERVSQLTASAMGAMGRSELYGRHAGAK